MAKKKGSTNPIPMVFGRVADLPIPTDSILIVPSEDRWNDFGYRTKVEVYVNLNGKLWSEGAYIGFLTSDPEEPADADAINSQLSKGSDLVMAVTESMRFFTMLPQMRSYRSIVQTYGPGQAVRVLRTLRDLVVLKEFPSNANWLDLAVRSDVFLKSFMRTSESFFAYHNAGPVLRGLEQEEAGTLSKNIGITFKLAGRGSEHKIHFHFDHKTALPKRIAVVIGKNGVGKSQTLGRIANAALTDNRALTDLDTHHRPMLNRLLAFAPTNEAKSVFPSDRRRRPKIWYKRFSLNRSEYLTQANGVAGLIVQVARSEEYIRNTARWDIFLSAVGAIHRSDQIQLPSVHGHYLSLNDLRSSGEKISLENYGLIDERKDPVRVIDGQGYPLSSGEISFLRFAAQASLHIENGSLLLLDEPETHLHPNFISQLVLLLDNLLRQTGSAAIIATHSVYFVREVFPAQVTVLRVAGDGEVLAEKPRLQTFGADVGAISYFVFGEDEPSRLAARVEKTLLAQFNNWDDLYNEYKSELSTEVLGALREAMEGRANNE